MPISFSGVCNEPMLSDELAPIQSITASSSKPESSPKDVVISEKPSDSDKPTSWQPEDTDEEPYIEFKFNELIIITKIITKGGENGEFVPEFKIKSSVSDDVEPEFQTVIEDGTDGEPQETVKVYPGNNDDDTEVTHPLGAPVIASVIRIYPVRAELNIPVSLQVDIFGCLVVGTTAEPTTTKAAVVTTSAPGTTTTAPATTTKKPTTETTTRRIIITTSGQTHIITGTPQGKHVISTSLTNSN